MTDDSASAAQILTENLTRSPLLYGDYRVTQQDRDLTDECSYAPLRDSDEGSHCLDTTRVLRRWAPEGLVVWLRPAALFGPADGRFIRPRFDWRVHLAPGTVLQPHRPRGSAAVLRSSDGSGSSLAPEQIEAGPDGLVADLAWVPWEVLPADDLDPVPPTLRHWHLIDDETRAVFVLGLATTEEIRR